jgi:hypothetical protein
VRLRAYDYGVVSIALSRGFAGDWRELVAWGRRSSRTPSWNSVPKTWSASWCRPVTDALLGARESFLSEDYPVYVVHELERLQTATALLETHGEAIAAMLRGERQRLSEQETTKILRHRISHWPTISSSRRECRLRLRHAGRRQAALEIIEFANSQLSSSVTTTSCSTASSPRSTRSSSIPSGHDEWVGSRYRRAARKVHALFIDVNELTDRTENTPQVHRRYLRLAAFRARRQPARPRHWKANVHEKLKTLDDVYRFAVSCRRFRAASSWSWRSSSSSCSNWCCSSWG